MLITQELTMPTFFSTREIGETLHVPTWQIQRIFENGDVPEPGRFAGKRAIPGELIPAIVDALRARGWLPEKQEAAPCA